MPSVHRSLVLLPQCQVSIKVFIKFRHHGHLDTFSMLRTTDYVHPTICLKWSKKASSHLERGVEDEVHRSRALSRVEVVYER